LTAERGGTPQQASTVNLPGMAFVRPPRRRPHLPSAGGDVKRQLAALRRGQPLATKLQDGTVHGLGVTGAELRILAGLVVKESSALPGVVAHRRRRHRAAGHGCLGREVSRLYVRRGASADDVRQAVLQAAQHPRDLGLDLGCSTYLCCAQKVLRCLPIRQKTAVQIIRQQKLRAIGRPAPSTEKGNLRKRLGNRTKTLHCIKAA
jgi:hypothetical protein